MSDWLRNCAVTHVALESTGVHGKPVGNLREGQFEVRLVNAQHIQAVPGRKTDPKDSEWIADLLQHGLLRGSFVPPTPIRELRDRTRYQASLAQEINRIANRIQKVWEDANIQLASVATDTWGAWGPGDVGSDHPGRAGQAAAGGDVAGKTAEQDSGVAAGLGRDG